MPPKSDMREAEIGRLYALPLDEFTPARDELARRLGNEGDRERAKEVKRLRKPSLAAWALNQVRRDDPRGVEELLAAGEQLRGSTERLLSGETREAFERAIAEERRLVQELAHHGERQLLAAGHSVTAGAQNKLVATLRAVARDSGARELLSAGRLVRDHEISDLGLDVSPAADQKVSNREPDASAESEAADRAKFARKVRSLRQRLERAQGRLQKTEGQVRAAEHRVEEAQHQAARATSALEREEAGARQARGSAHEAGERVAELEASLRKLESTGG